MDLLLAFIIAMIVTMTLIPPLERAAGSLRVLDQPGERKVHARPIPCVGGLAMAAGSFVPLLIWLPVDRLLGAYLSAAAIMVIFGVWDDRRGLGPWTKLAGQFAAVLIVVLVGEVSISSFTLTERLSIPDAIAFPLTILFLLGVTNAINLADGLDGLAGGTTLLSCAAMALLGLTLDIPFVAVVSLVITGSILGFLRFNTHPARIFMGDGGSQFLGFTVGVLSVLLTQNASVPLSAALPLLLLGLPILDTLTVMALRLHRGESPLKADQKHIHHKLLALGFDHHEAVSLIYVAQALMFLAAWFLRFESDLLIFAAFLLFAAIILALLAVKRAGWRIRRADARPGESALARLRRWLAAIQRLPRWALWIVAICVAAYTYCVPAFVNPLPRDVGWLAVGLAAVLVLVAMRRQRGTGTDWLAQGALYVAIVAAVYLDHQNVTHSATLQAVKWIAFPLLVLGVIVRMRISGERRFRLTALDALLIFGALALPNLPGLVDAPSSLGLAVAKLTVLFYGIEMISSHSERTRRFAWVGGLAFCAFVAVHTFFPQI